MPDGGGALCWGSNTYGELGDGTTAGKTTPVAVVGLDPGATAIAGAGSPHTCALIAGGGLRCWGSNDSGQLGDGTWEGRATPAGVVGLGSGTTSVTTGGFHTCAVVAGGALCWGSKYSELGGDNAKRTTPVTVIGFGP